MLSKYDIILFDSDNTLYDHNIHERSAIFQAFEQYGAPITEEMYLLYRKVNDDIWKEFERGVKHEKGPLVERFVRFSNFTGTAISPHRINELYVEALSRQCSPFPDSLEVCKALSEQHTLYIITNGTESVQLRRFHSSPLRPFFADIFTAAGMGVQKPQKEFFDRVLSRIGNPDSDRVIIIGDSLTSDILGGVNAGIDTCWFNPEHKKNAMDFSPTYEIDDLKKLL